MSHRLPSTLEIRNRIDEIGNSIHPIEDRRVAKNLDEHQIQMALKYQYLVAGRVSEVAGKYQPSENLAYLVNIKGIKCVLFSVKTAKRKTETGWSLRGPTVPYNRRYEPWAKELYEYLKDNKYPFKFAEKDISSKRILEASAAYTFNGLSWLLKPSGGRQSRWVPFTSHSLRRARSLMLYTFYHFNPYDLLYYGNWEDKDMAKVPSNLKHYLYVEMNQSPYALEMMKRLAENYIEKLCLPFESVHFSGESLDES